MKTILILLLTIFSVQFTNTEKELNAGVMPYAIDQNGKVFILLGEDGKYWEDFIGGPKTIDKGNTVETAVREFTEETNCYFEKDKIKAKVEKATPIFLNKTTVRFIIEIQKVDINKLLNSRTKCNDVEKTNYCWISATELLDSIDSAKDDKHVYIPSRCNGKTNKLDKKMRKNLIKGSESRNQIEAILKKNKN